LSTDILTHKKRVKGERGQAKCFRLRGEKTVEKEGAADGGKKGRNGPLHGTD